jgi:hypothetical protein
VTAVLLVAAVLVALPGAAAALHLGLLAAASLAYAEPRPAGPVTPVRFLTLVPAHDEAAVIGRTLAAIAADRRPHDRVLVVADRCTDATAAIARAHGALVIERAPHEPPGRAAARQAGIGAALALGGWDALVMIDADSVVEPGFHSACERALALGAPALQARSEAELRGGLVAQASLAAFALQGLTMPRGRDRLGLLVRLRGTGMVLTRQVVERFGFTAPASEDLWFSLDLCLAGIRPRHVESARLRSASVRSWGAAAGQRTRYEAGRVSAAREYLPRLLDRPSPAALEAAWWLATPPFAVAAASLAAGLGVALLAGLTPLAWGLGALLLLLGAVLAVALVQARAGLGTWLALLAAPWYVLWKLGVQARALASVRRGQTTYGPTAR